METPESNSSKRFFKDSGCLLLCPVVYVVKSKLYQLIERNFIIPLSVLFTTLKLWNMPARAFWLSFCWDIWMLYLMGSSFFIFFMKAMCANIYIWALLLIHRYTLTLQSYTWFMLQLACLFFCKGDLFSSWMTIFSRAIYEVGCWTRTAMTSSASSMMLEKRLPSLSTLLNQRKWRREV